MKRRLRQVTASALHRGVKVFITNRLARPSVGAFLTALLLLVTNARPVCAERMTIELEWGFGPVGAEMYWDGTFRLTEGRLVSMRPVSFEADRHDKLVAPAGFRSFTLGNGTDGMLLVVEGGEKTRLRLTSKQGNFQWSLAELRKKGELSFASRGKGKLVIRMSQLLGDDAQSLSDGKTQDSDPAICRLSDGRQLVLWRAFQSPTSKGGGRDQIRARVIGKGGEAGPIFNLLEKAGDVESIAVAPLNDSACQVVWAEQRGRNWDLYARVVKVGSKRLQPGAVTRLTRAPGVDKSPAMTRVADGSLMLVWQSWQAGRSSVFSREFRDRKWGDETVQLSDGEANDWNPAVAASPRGKVAAAWSSWRNGSYDIHLRQRVDGKWGPLLAVASGEQFEAHPRLAYDDAEVLWIAYEEGRAGWGMDSHTAGLRAQRDVRLRICRNGAIETPTQTTALVLPGKYRGRSEMPHLAVDGRGAMWLFFRHLTGRGVWKLMGSSLGRTGWSPPGEFHSAAGGQNVAMASSINSPGDLTVVWSADGRTNQVGKDSRLYKSTLASRNLPRPRLSSKMATASIKKRTQKPTRITKLFGKQKRALYFGDLHRHTELSVCRTNTDGSLEDAYRYAIDAAELDFLCITDHIQHVKVLNDYDFWRTGKTADLHRVAGLHEPLYGYERSQRWPYGHRNIISPTRNPRRVPRTTDNRPWSANNGYAGEKRIAPPQLWEKLAGQNVITIPHSSGSPIMGTNFGHRPAAIEPVVEIYQGCRYSYEHPNAPDPRPNRDSNPYGGAVKAGGSIWDALAKGYQYGFIASSDHSATHNSYTCVWADEFSPSAILEAISKRRCYAATDRIVCDMRMGEHLMGAEFTASTVPPLDVNVTGTTNIARVDIIKDNRIVYTYLPAKPSAVAVFTFQDMQAKPGRHYYYARIMQQDRNMAWVSPIWVNVKPARGK